VRQARNNRNGFKIKRVLQHKLDERDEQRKEWMYSLRREEETPELGNGMTGKERDQRARADGEWRGASVHGRRRKQQRDEGGKKKKSEQDLGQSHLCCEQCRGRWLHVLLSPPLRVLHVAPLRGELL
jgi:hypothetical protein